MKKTLFKIGATFSALALTASVAFAEAVPVTIPDAGVDVSAYITEAITAMGAVAAVAVGGFACFFIIKKALRWMSLALK